MSKSILVVDDDELMRTFITTVLREDGYGVDMASDGKTGLNKVKNRDFDLVITDLKMPDMSGVDLMQAGREAKPAMLWVIITAYGSINNAVEAMKAGAVDYLTKPFKSPDELRHVIRRVLKGGRGRGKNSLPFRRAWKAVSSYGDDLSWRQDAKGPRNGTERCGHDCYGIDQRPERYRQGACGTGNPPAQSAA